MIYLACFPEEEFFKRLTLVEYRREGVCTTHLQTVVFYNFKSTWGFMKLCLKKIFWETFLGQKHNPLQLLSIPKWVILKLGRLSDQLLGTVKRLVSFSDILWSWNFTEYLWQTKLIDVVFHFGWHHQNWFLVCGLYISHVTQLLSQQSISWKKF